MLQFVASSRSSLVHLFNKAWQWFRIGLAMYRLNRVDANEREFARSALAKAMGEARGLAMKIGQFMAGVDDDANPYHVLAANFNPIPLYKIKPALEKHLQGPVEHVFKAFDEAAAAASLGQVHHAVTANGIEVAVKIRYPGIIEAVEAELALSDYLPAGGPVKRWRINASDYKNVLRRQLLRETDYSIEMQTQQRFKRNFRVTGLRIPDIHAELCGDAVLVQSWENGSRLNEVCKWSKKDRLEIGRTLLMTLFQGLFVNGEVHGDPHPGNYLFKHDEENLPQTILLDFGCTILIQKQSRMALLKLIDCFRSEKIDECDPFTCFVAMGFDAEKLSHLHGDMSHICSVLLRPFLVDRPFHLAQWQVSKELTDVLQEKRWWFRSAGPADLFLLLRAFHGLVQQLEKLDVSLPWWPLLKHVVGDQMLEHARNFELPVVDVVSRVGVGPSTKDKARKLCVRMLENDAVRVSVDLPAEAAYDLESIIPGQVLLMLLSNTQVDIAKLGKRLREEGLLPQLIFDFKAETKHCRIWLE